MNCYDTNFLVAYQNGVADTLEFLEAHTETAHAVSPVSLFELYRGDVIGHSGQDPEDTRQGLGWIDDVLQFDERTALRAAELLEQIRARGGQLEPVDAMIAASADRAGATVVTRDDDLLAPPAGNVLDVEPY